MTKVLKAVQIARSALSGADRGFVVTLGFVHDRGQFHFLAEAGRWDDDLVDDLRAAWARSRAEESTEPHLKAV